MNFMWTLLCQLGIINSAIYLELYWAGLTIVLVLTKLNYNLNTLLTLLLGIILLQEDNGNLGWDPIFLHTR